MDEKTRRAWPDLTIVGGQPRRRPKSRGKIRIPVGVEKLLYRAAQDDEFEAALLDDPVAAAEAAGISLRPSEEAMLRVVPRQALERMLAGIEPANPRRRRFMGLVAAAAASLAAGTAGCDDSDGDPDSDTIDHDSGFVNAGGIDGDLDVDVDVDSDSDSDTMDYDSGFVNAGGIDGDMDVDVDSDIDADSDQETDVDADADSLSDAEADSDVDAETDPDADV